MYICQYNVKSMARYKKPDVTNLSEFINPFSESLVIKTVKIPNGYLPADVDGIKDIKYKEIEQQSSLKTFMTAELRLVMMAIMPKTNQLLSFLTAELKPGEDFVVFNRKRYQEESNTASNTTVHNALLELIARNLICKTSIKDVYWINPRYFFHGSRVNKYPDKCVASNDINRSK